MNDPALDDRGGKFRFTLRGMLVGILVLSIVLGVLKWLTDAIVAARRSAFATSEQGPFNQLQVALRNYHEVHGHFPPAYLVDEVGKPMHSWRVLVLPYLDHRSLYDAYRFDEPWNSPHNMQLAKVMPQEFRSDTDRNSDMFTNIVAIVGPGTAFPGSTSTSLTDFADGKENTILLAEITDSDICWLQPRDLKVDQMSFSVNDDHQPSISSARWREPYVVFADHIKAYAVSRDIPPEALKALITIAGGEPVTRSQLARDGHLR